MNLTQTTPFHPFWRNTMRISVTRLVAASAVLALTAGTAQAETVIYQDDFSGTSSGLNGTTPNVGANNWVAAPMFNADGSIVNADTDSIDGGSATLAFTPDNGLVYTLDLSLTDMSGDANWVAFGFADGQSSELSSNNRFINDPDVAVNATIGRAWMLVRGDTAATTHKVSMDGTTDHIDWDPTFATGGGVDLQIVLDTTGGAGNWTAAWYAKKTADATYTLVRAEEGLATEDVTSVGFARSNDGVLATATSFSLTSVPEPSSLALLGLGGLLIARRRRNA